MLCSIYQKYSYFLLQPKDESSFWELENFPTYSKNICQSDFIIYIFDDEITPLILPYQQKQYSPDWDILEGHALPWSKFLEIFKHYATQWEMRGRLSIIFSPQMIHLPYNYVGKPIYYSLSSFPYGYIIVAEKRKRLRRPDEFPIHLNSIYSTRYLVFYDSRRHQRAFFSYKAQEHRWDERKKQWAILEQEQEQDFLTRIIAQLAGEHWQCQGELEIKFCGIRAGPDHNDLVRFLFSVTSFEQRVVS